MHIKRRRKRILALHKIINADLSSWLKNQIRFLTGNGIALIEGWKHVTRWPVPVVQLLRTLHKQLFRPSSYDFLVFQLHMGRNSSLKWRTLYRARLISCSIWRAGLPKRRVATLPPGTVCAPHLIPIATLQCRLE